MTSALGAPVFEKPSLILNAQLSLAEKQNARYTCNMRRIEPAPWQAL
jgi:hypothetical protein